MSKPRGIDGNADLEQKVMTMRLEADVSRATMAEKDRALEAASSGAAQLAAQLQRSDRELKLQQQTSMQYDELAQRRKTELVENSGRMKLIVGRDALERTDYLAVCGRLEKANKQLNQWLNAQAERQERGTDPPHYAGGRVALPIAALPPVTPITPHNAMPQNRILLPRGSGVKHPRPTDLETAKKLLRDAAAFTKAFQCCSEGAAQEMPTHWQQRQIDVLGAAAQGKERRRSRSAAEEDRMAATGSSAADFGIHSERSPAKSGRRAVGSPDGHSPHARMRDMLHEERAPPAPAPADDAALHRPLPAFIHSVAASSASPARERRDLLRRLAFADSQLRDKVAEVAELKAALAAREGAAAALAPAGADLSAERVRQQLRALRHDVTLAKEAASGQARQQDAAAAQVVAARAQLASLMTPPPGSAADPGASPAPTPPPPPAPPPAGVATPPPAAVAVQRHI